ncbi:NOP15 [Lepeophtheirus salmonis]|uniref:NOP15 n=1 Tax=Lepeophtheirus salmonis TaxID=72036 RepID=A0A7R8CZE5_LEPSM|nr:NOP15 [Lepeophtheirus salmonis]CAF2975280.1 NOP15 [Lepeophtheirus salmonis]
MAKRAAMLSMVKDLTVMDEDKRDKTLDSLLKSMFKVLSEVKSQVQSAGMSLKDIPEDKKEQRIRGPSIRKYLLSANNDYNTLYRWSLSYISYGDFPPSLINEPTKKLIHLATQELGVGERDPDYVNPYKKKDRPPLKRFEDPPIAPKKSKKKVKRGPRRGVVYINHLPHGFYENQLYAFLSQFGTVTNLRVGRSSKTGNPKGYAFAEFLYPEILKCSVVSKSRLSRRIFKNKIHPNNPPAPKIRAKSKHALNNVNVSDEVVEKRKYKQYGKLIKLQKMLQEAGIETTIKIPKTVLKAKSETETDKTETVKKPKVKTPSQRPLISLVLDDKIKSLKRKRISDQTKGKQNSDSSLSSTSRPAQASPETPSNMNKKIKNAVDVKQGTTPERGEALTTTSQTPSHSKNSMDQAEASSSGKVMLKSGSKKRKRQSLSGDSVQVVEGSSKQEDANLSFSSDKKVASKSPKAKKAHKAPPVPQKMSSSPTLQESNQSSSSCPTTPVSSQGGKKNPSTPSTSKKK